MLVLPSQITFKISEAKLFLNPHLCLFPWQAPQRLGYKGWPHKSRLSAKKHHLCVKEAAREASLMPRMLAT